MNGFLKQIKEDIGNFKKNYGKEIESPDEWWLNFWVLEKLFYVDGEIALDYITENNDSGIDCFFYDEETKDLYLIQNKFYSNDTNVKKEELSYFLSNPLKVLNDGRYTRNTKLQKIYNDIKDDEEATVHLMFNVTNDKINDDFKNMVKTFNQNSKNRAYYNNINDLKNIYYNYEGSSRKDFETNFETHNKGTILNIDNENYGLNLKIDARFVMTNISYIFKLIKNSKEVEYPIFAENIREYLGQNSINKKIKNTLIDEKARSNFFYYNNGITIVCDDFGPASNNFKVTNPQIVNGCQTSSTIYETLKDYDDVDKKFKDSFVMVKLLKVDKENDLLKDIVLYNNSQNKVDEKNLEAQRNELKRVQKEFENNSLFLLLKQSDKNKLKEKYGTGKINKEDFKINKTFNELVAPEKITDLHVPIEKLLQVILCYKKDAHRAYTDKSKLLKTNSKTNKLIMEDIVNNNENTVETYLNLWTLYSKLEKDKKIYEDTIPFYVLMCLNKFIIKNNSEVLSKLLQNEKDLEFYRKFYMKAIMHKYKKEINLETNTMIKTQINEELLVKSVSETAEMLDEYYEINKKYE